MNRFIGDHFRYIAHHPTRYVEAPSMWTPQYVEVPTILNPVVLRRHSGHEMFAIRYLGELEGLGLTYNTTISSRWN